MLKKGNAKHGFSRGRLVFLALAFLAINALILGGSSFSSETAQWLLILVLDSFLLVGGLLIVFLGRPNSIDLVKGEPLDGEPEMATVMVDRLKKYVYEEEKENTGL